ncbi:MAG TPA: response regulator, partial [Actinomycetota bacterium]|nr:response regulator [Actinomycetota bacterium]
MVRSEATKETVLEQISVLIAEDDTTVREALADLIDAEESLQLIGSAKDASEAIDLARKYRPDVALVDVKMPGGGGSRAAREIIISCPSTRVIALSAYDDRMTIVELLRAGASGYLVKGESTDVLETIRRAMRGEVAISAELTTGVIRELLSLIERSEQVAKDLEELGLEKATHLGQMQATVFERLASISTAARQLEQLSPALVGRIKAATAQLTRLAQRMTATNRLETRGVEISLQPVPVNDLMKAVRRAFPESHGRITLALDVDDALECWADPDLLLTTLVAAVETVLVD